MKIRACMYKIIVVLVIGLLMLTVLEGTAGNPFKQGRQEDQVIDEDGNTHKIYSQGGDIYYKNDIGSSTNLPFTRWNDPVRLTDTLMPAFHPRIEISDGFVYGTWVQKHPEEDRLNYAGSLLEDPETWGSPIDVAEVPENLTGYKYEMEVVDGTVMLCWDGECELSWSADIDGDMIPDIEDENPLEYDVENDHVDFEPDVVSIDPELDVSVALAFEDEDDVLPTIEEVEGDFEHSIGRYVNIDVETDSGYRGLVKSGYGWSENTSEYLRVYRETDEVWSVVTDWEDDEYTGVNLEREHSWALVNELGTFTLAPANEIDGDIDGLSDLTEGTEPEDLTDTVHTHSSFTDLNFEDEEVVTHLNLSFEEYSIYTVTGGYIELSAVDQPVEDLELDIGGDGRVNWRATMPLEDSTRVGQIWKPINVYIFENYINTCETDLEVPLVFTSSNDAPFEISYANVQVEQRITSNYEVDTSGDGLWDGWQDRNADMTFDRAGADGVLGTEHDNVPGALAYGLDPTEEHLIGGPGRSEVQTYHEGMSSVNAVSGNLMLGDRDLGFSSLAHDIAVERSYNSQSDHEGVFGPGWQMNHEQRLEFEDDDPIYVDEAGTRYEFEHLGDGTYEPAVDNPYSMVANLPEPPEQPGLEENTVDFDNIEVDLIQVQNAEEYELRLECQYPKTVDHYSFVDIQSVSWDGLDPGTEYEVSAKSIDEYGQESSWTYLTVETLGKDDGEEEPMDTDESVKTNTISSTITSSEKEYVIRDTNGLKRYFNEDGLIKRKEDRNGNNIFFNYQGGNLVRISDDTGKELSLSYTDGRLSSVTDPIGRTVQYSYNSEGYLVEYTDAMDNTYSYTYENGLIDRVYEPARDVVVEGETKTVRTFKEYEFVEDPVEGMLNNTNQGYIVVNNEEATTSVDEEKIRTISSLDYDYASSTSLYDASDNETLDVFDESEAVRIKHVNPDGNESHFDYDGELNNNKVIDKKGGEWTTDHGPLGTTEEFITPLGDVEYWDWDIKDTDEEFIAVMTEYINEMGDQWINEFDDNFNMVQSIDSSGSVTEYEYTDDGQMSRRIEPNGAVWEYEYDGYGNLIKEIDPEGAVTEHEYDCVNRKVKTVSPNGAVTEYAYDELDREIEVIDAYGNTEESVYDSTGNLIERTDKLGATTTYEYDHYGRLVRETDALGNSMEYEYDERDNVIKETNRRGFPTYREYDEMNRLVREEDRWGNYESYEYDEFHNVVKRTDKLGNEWVSEYDEVNRLVAEYNPLGEGTQYEYDEAGNMIKEIDAMGYETEYEYDSEGSLVRTVGAEGSEVLYEYDEVGNQVSVTQVGDEVNSEWQYEYDLLGRKEKEITPLDEEYTWEYDEVGDVVRYETPSGDVTEYEYDLLGRLTQVELPNAVDIDIEYTLFEKEREEYDHPPRLTYLHPYAPQITAQSQEYDLLGRLSRESWQVNGDEYDISYVYDEEGNVIEMTDQLGNVTSYTYDCRNRLRSVTDPDGDTTEYNYDPANRLTETIYPTGTKILRDYDDANRLTKISNVRSDSSLISSFEHEYDANGRRTLMREMRDEGKVGEHSSMDLDKNDNAHVSYYDSTRGDLKYVYLAGDKPVIETVDYDIDIGEVTSLKVDDDGGVHISYHDSSQGTLKYATRTSDGWVTETVDEGDVGEYSSIDIDGSGVVHISYYDSNDGVLKYARSTNDGWSTEVVDDGDDVGMYSSIAVSEEGTAHISYHDVSNKNLKYAEYNGGGWSIVTVDDSIVEFDTSIALDQDGHPRISYVQLRPEEDDTVIQSDLELSLRYAAYTGDDWIIETVDEGDVGKFSSIAVDADDNTHISYYDSSNSDLKYAENIDGYWNLETVDSDGDVGKYSSLSIDGQGDVHISYYDASDSNLNLVKGTGADWSTESVIRGSSMFETHYEYDGEDRLTYVDYPGETSVGYGYDRRSNINKRTYYEGNEVENEVTSEYDEGNRLVNMDGVEYEYDEEGNQLGVDSEGDSSFMSTYLSGEKLNYRMEVVGDEDSGVPGTSYGYSLDGRRVGKEIAWDENDTTEWERIHYLYDGQNVLYEYGDNHPTVRYTHPVACDGGVCGPTSDAFVDAP
ncbi:MAG: DUF6531 domain-containing protein, partial [Candidatus Saliniplasma sp.]